MASQLARPSSGRLGTRDGARTNGSLFLLCLIWTVVLGGLLVFWRHLVNGNVSEPYLDEVFHIPQAQAYCVNNFGYWDPKITTPPGLYLVSRIATLLSISCTTASLRAINSIFLLLGVFPASFLWRASSKSLSLDLTTTTQRNAWRRRLANDLHAAFNVCLFPPLFFFTALYYTDVGSTAVVLWMLVLVNGCCPSVAGVGKIIIRTVVWSTAAWLLSSSYFMPVVFLALLAEIFVWLLGNSSGVSAEPTSIGGDGGASFTVVVLLGIAALSFRQTNVFWVAIFPVGLRLMSQTQKTEDRPSNMYLGLLPKRFEDWLIIFDPLVDQAELKDYVQTTVSTAAAVVSGLGVRLRGPFDLGTMRYITTVYGPFSLILLIFASFVVWNGGVVLGDKSNHIATIHLAQILYLWAYIAFFSLPLICPYLLTTVDASLGLISNVRINLPDFLKPYQTTFPFHRPLNILFTFIIFLAVLAIIYFNTIVHPFTLADNRHYVFYVFRLLVLRHPAIKYCVAPAYLICGWLCIRTLGTPQTPSETQKPSSSKSASKRNETTPRTKKDSHHQASSSPSDTKFHSRTSLEHPAPDQVETRVNYLLFWLATTILCLVTAPLVEPRYFILPWILWRLQVPSPSTLGRNGEQRQGHGNPAQREGPDRLLLSTDHRLWIETVWFLIINGATGYMFLYREFEWVQEPGKLQRFLW